MIAAARMQGVPDDSAPTTRQERLAGDYEPPDFLSAVDLSQLIDTLLGLDAELEHARSAVAGCTTRLNLSELDLALRDARTAVASERARLIRAGLAIVNDEPLPVRFPENDRWEGEREWCVPGRGSELLSPRQIGFLLKRPRDPAVATISYRAALRLNRAVPKAAARHISEHEVERAAREALEQQCPFCGAAPGEQCVTQAGRPTGTHHGRRK